MLARRGRFRILGGTIEHVGSTAVPGLDAKPVIDLMVRVRDIRRANHCILTLEGIGYSYWAENPNPERMLFVKFVDADRTSRTHNLHVVEMGGDLWNDRLVFRDYLRAHPKTAREYVRLNTICPAASEMTRSVHRGQGGLRLHGVGGEQKPRDRRARSGSLRGRQTTYFMSATSSV